MEEAREKLSQWILNAVREELWVAGTGITEITIGSHGSPESEWQPRHSMSVIDVFEAFSSAVKFLRQLELAQRSEVTLA